MVREEEMKDGETVEQEVEEEEEEKVVMGRQENQASLSFTAV